MNPVFKKKFLQSDRPHILMVTNHGIHDWIVRSGLVDTGGQNHYVNSLSGALVARGFRVTICNRGGFSDPVSGRSREGVSYKDEYSRILYLSGGGSRFIRKEDLNRSILSEEAQHAAEIFGSEQQRFCLLISHYWDGAVLGHLIREKMDLGVKHVWIPHSLGALKQANFADKPKAVIAACRFEERIEQEREVLKAVDYIASTSGDITKTLSDFYGRGPELFVPPCIDTALLRPVDRKNCKDIYAFLAKEDPVAGRRLKEKTCLLEVSRTDRTKRKDIVIQAFAELSTAYPGLMLLLTLSKDNNELYSELMALIHKSGLRGRTVCIGTIPRDWMSELYALAEVYCSPSEMEGFGMSVQEACACGRPTVSSDRVPFAVEYLLERASEEVIKTSDGPCKIRWGKGGVVVPAGKTEGFAHALRRLLSDKPLRTKMAEEAYRTTIPRFTWPQMVKKLLQEVGLDKVAKK